MDRDGTINVHNAKGYVYKKNDFRFMPYVFSALKKLSQSNYKIIIVTNQAGIGRGYYTVREMNLLHDWMLSKFKAKKIRIDKIYYCPHSPSENCGCRKPRLGMIKAAKRDFKLDLTKSWMVGDDAKDIVFGKRVKLKTIKLPNKSLPTGKVRPNCSVRNLSEAAAVILSN